MALRETNETLFAVIAVSDSENNAFPQSIAKRKARVFRIEMKNSSKNMPEYTGVALKSPDFSGLYVVKAMSDNLTANFLGAIFGSSFTLGLNLGDEVESPNGLIVFMVGAVTGF